MTIRLLVLQPSDVDPPERLGDWPEQVHAEMAEAWRALPLLGH